MYVQILNICVIKKLVKIKLIVIQKKKKNTINNYQKCLANYDTKKNKLCSRGYCTAKQKFEVYPSAYANGYASGVCFGTKPDYNNKIYPDQSYLENKKKIKLPKNSNLTRWFDEKWVNVCEKDKSKEGYKPCGTGKGITKLDYYPYCRPYYKLPGTNPITVEEIKSTDPSNVDTIFNTMCSSKRSKKQGVKGKPTYIKLKDYYPDLVKKIMKARKNN